MSTEIIFEVTEDPDCGFSASALGYGIHTQGDTADELRAAVRDAVSIYFDDPATAPRIIRLHYVRDEVMAA
jgi:predicted RNase H-like HicB family nuclease